MKELIWQATEKKNNFSLSIKRPCACGCDERDGKKGVGYIIGKDNQGNGVTIWIENEETFLRLQKIIKALFQCEG